MTWARLVEIVSEAVATSWVRMRCERFGIEPDDVAQRVYLLAATRKPELLTGTPVFSQGVIAWRTVRDVVLDELRKQQRRMGHEAVGVDVAQVPGPDLSEARERVEREQLADSVLRLHHYLRGREREAFKAAARGVSMATRAHQHGQAKSTWTRSLARSVERVRMSMQEVAA